jgi:glyoxylase-like metal-dependent hydrolase (beta-lactamase superfamily II)
MILRQLLHQDPVVAASYLIGCGGKGVAAVIDPVAESRVYLDLATTFGTRIAFVVDTHLHADHASTGRELAAECGAEYVLHQSATPAYPFRTVAEGDQLVIGNVTLEVLHLPGHTPEHLGLVAVDRTRSDRPWLVFTGHTLMVGDMGRTELASSADEGARQLYQSASKLRALPDDVVVLPGAVAGSVCGRGLSGTPQSTVGFERSANRAFSIIDQATFVDYMLRDIPPRPANAEEHRRTNLGLPSQRPAVSAAPEPAAASDSGASASRT